MLPLFISTKNIGIKPNAHSHNQLKNRYNKTKIKTYKNKGGKENGFWKGNKQKQKTN